MRLRSPSSTRDAKAKTSPGQDLVFIYIAKTLGLLVLLCFGTPSSSTKNVVQLPSPRPSSSTTTACTAPPTTVAEDPCNGTVKFDYLRVYRYFHYRRENDYFHYGS